MGMTARRGSVRGAAGLMALVMTAAAPSPIHAQPRQSRLSFAIPAGSLQHALVAFAARTDIQLLYASNLVAGRTAPRLIGGFTADEALARILAGSGLTVHRVSERVMVIEARPAVTRTGLSRAGAGRGVSDAASALAASRPSSSLSSPAPQARTEPEPEPGQIVVTGSHIRGGAPGTPPIKRIDRSDLDRQGFPTIARALQALPGNFGGMATEQSAATFADVTGSNGSFGSGVNLRGLGAGATLVLVNGQRLGGSGDDGAYADVSTIPTGALDRVEILEDGASAVYGSDAVGGVVNILLRKRFQGLESRLRLGSVTTGGKRDVQADQTMGTRWESGGAMLAYEYAWTGRLRSADRRFAASEDLRPLGGTDHSLIVSAPGNILGFDPATGAIGVSYAIRPSADGGPPAFLAGTANRENRRRYSDLIPRQARHSVYAAADQEIASGVTLSADVRYTHRAYDSRFPPTGGLVQIGAANPYFVSPSGAPVDLIAYSFGPEAGPIRSHGAVEDLAGSTSLDADLGGSWKLRSYGAFTQTRQRTRGDGMLNSSALAEAVGSVPDDPTTPFSTARDGYFNPYGAGGANPASMIAFITNGFNAARIRSRVLSVHVDADGALVALPGGDLKVALGGDLRREAFNALGTGRGAGIAIRTLYDVAGSRTVSAGFAELRVPLVGTGNAQPWLQSLALSVAGRVEHYAGIGTTANPKLGASLSPTQGLTIRANWGTSFRAPNLRQLRDAQQYVVTTLTGANGALIPVIQLSGGNPDLKPEKARSWTAGVDLQPASLPGLAINATWFHTVFRDRIATPANENFANALLDPALAPFVERLSPSTNPADLARITALYADPAFGGSNGFPPASIGAVVDTRSVNTGRVTVAGLDLAVRYTLPVGANRFDITVSGTYLDQWRERVTPTSSSIDRRNQVGRPIDLRGRASLGWTRGIANAYVTLNHVAGYRDPTRRPIAAWNTVDAEIGLTAPDTAGWLAGTSIAIAVTNLFDAAPPFYDNPGGIGYDATNADALGRFVSVQLTRRW